MVYISSGETREYNRRPTGKGKEKKMTLKDLQKINYATLCYYTAYDEDGNEIEHFTVDYIGQHIEHLGAAVTKRSYYEDHKKTKVKSVMVNGHCLEVDFIVKNQ